MGDNKLGHGCGADAIQFPFGKCSFVLSPTSVSSISPYPAVQERLHFSQSHGTNRICQTVTYTHIHPTRKGVAYNPQNNARSRGETTELNNKIFFSFIELLRHNLLLIPCKIDSLLCIQYVHLVYVFLDKGGKPHSSGKNIAPSGNE